MGSLRFARFCAFVRFTFRSFKSAECLDSVPVGCRSNYSRLVFCDSGSQCARNRLHSLFGKCDESGSYCGASRGHVLIINYRCDQLLGAWYLVLGARQPTLRFGRVNCEVRGVKGYRRDHPHSSLRTSLASVFLTSHFSLQTSNFQLRWLSPDFSISKIQQNAPVRKGSFLLAQCQSAMIVSMSRSICVTNDRVRSNHGSTSSFLNVT